MYDFKARERELSQLLDFEPERSGSGLVRRLARKLRVRAPRSQLATQRRIDAGLLELHREGREDVADLRGQVAATSAQLVAAQTELGSVWEELRGVREQLSDVIAGPGGIRACGEHLRGLQDWVTRLDGQVGGLREWVQRTDAEVGGAREWLQSLGERTDAVAAWTEAASRDREALHSQLAALARRVPEPIPLDTEGPFKLERFVTALGAQVIGYRRSGAADTNGVYLGFEDVFRGEEKAILERQEAYLPLLNRHGPVLDVGCGRGEMLQLLHDHGVPARGIDLDEAMVERCRKKGLSVQVAEAASHLATVPAHSLGAVFAAQVIEHLPYDALLRFLHGASAALRSSGVLVVETVNPHSPQALKHFWIDPTHQHPLFPEVVLALCRLTGFAEGYIWYIHGTGDLERDRLECFDYAVVAMGPLARVLSERDAE